ncbi:MAG: beta-N-acetylhexosaminidase [Bacillaceae bacterium]|nr:beta-N-acetylhexosaminidase [Bacillaceae bacterium]
MNEINLSKMDLPDKVGQLMMFGFAGTTPSGEIKEMIRRYRVGGIILFSRNIEDTKQVLQLNRELQETARKAVHPLPLLIATDQENGIVHRLGQGSTVFPGNMAQAAISRDRDRLVYRISRATAKELKALGFNMNLAPVLDVNHNPTNPVIGVRSFGEDPQNVAKLGTIHLQGHRDAGVIPVIKHFPGHGDTEHDSHLELPVVEHDPERLARVELFPFRQAVEAGAESVMVAHIHFPAWDPDNQLPATLSDNIINNLLRKQIGFQGVTVSDCMEMKAITNRMPTPEAVVQSIKAGMDLILISHSYSLQKESVLQVIRAVRQKELDESLIDRACQRVMQLKRKYLDWHQVRSETKLTVPGFVGGTRHRELAREAYQSAVTLVQNKEGVIPLSPRGGEKTLVLCPQTARLTLVEDRDIDSVYLRNVVERTLVNGHLHFYSLDPDENETDKCLRMADHHTNIIVFTVNATHHPGQAQLVRKLVDRQNRTVIAVALRSPYDGSLFPEVPAFLATYEYAHAAIETAFLVISGRIEARGRLPVSIPDGDGKSGSPCL